MFAGMCLTAVTMVIWLTLPLHAEEVPAARNSGTDNIDLAPQHVEAVKRRRRIILQDDVLANGVFRTETVGPEQLSKVINFYMSRLDDVPNQIDSIWFEWGEGNTAVWPSKVIPETKNVFPKWWEIGVDPVDVLLQESRKRGREVFFSYRINGSDNDNLHDPARPSFGPEHPIPLKAAHPDWLIQCSPSAPADRKHQVAHRLHPYWNFAVPGVRDLKLRILREVAEKYEFDGIQIDFARVAALFPEGQQWANRDKLTEFMRSLRTMLLEIEKQRGRPFLLAARVPENLIGCHFDGMDVETWARENLVDILVLGCRSSDVDIAAFRRLTRGTGIKLYPCFDFHHVSDGYGNQYTTIEVVRGVYANWWNQSPDGVHTFNLMGPSPESAQIFPGGYRPPWETQRQVFREVGSPETLQHKDKVFHVQRRGGEQGSPPSDFITPRWGYFCTNLFAPLPVVLANDGQADTLLTLAVADDLNAAKDRIKEITLRILLSVTPPNVAENQRVEARINNLVIDPPRIEEGWVVFPVQPRQLAVGDNLVGVSLTGRSRDSRGQVSVEKVELHVKYR